MSVEISQEMVGLDAASAELDRLFAADAQPQAGDGQAQQPPAADPSANSGQDRAAQSGTTDAQPSTTDPKGPEQPTTQPAQQQTDKSQQQSQPQQQQPQDNKSRFSKMQERRERSWAELNAEKSKLQQDKAEIDKARTELEKQRQEIENARKQEEARYTPEQYEKAAASFEKQGKFDLAEAARERAAHLRAHPPQTPQQAQAQRQQQEQHQAQLKEWWGKAAIDFPAVAKDGSSENAALKTFLQAEPDAVRSPKGMYYAARLVNAESSAAKVPTLEKELGTLRARVKELEELTGPSPQSVPARTPGTEVRGDAEQYADLERLATEIGALR